MRILHFRVGLHFVGCVCLLKQGILCPDKLRCITVLQVEQQRLLTSVHFTLLYTAVLHRAALPH